MFPNRPSTPPNNVPINAQDADPYLVTRIPVDWTKNPKHPFYKPKKSPRHAPYPPTPIRPNLAEKVSEAMAKTRGGSASPLRRQARMSPKTPRSSKKATKENLSPSKQDGFFGRLADFVPWACSPSFDASSIPSGSFSSAPGAYPSSFTTPDLSSDDSDDQPTSPSENTPASSFIMENTDSLLAACHENNSMIVDYQTGQLAFDRDFQRALEEERAKMRSAAMWGATEEFKEKQRQQSEYAKCNHNGETVMQWHRDKQNLKELTEGMDRAERAELFARAFPTEHEEAERERFEREEVLRQEKEARLEMQMAQRKRRRDELREARRREAELSAASGGRAYVEAQEKAKTEAEAIRQANEEAQAKAAERQRAEAEARERTAFEQAERDARLEAQEDEKRHAEERWMRGDDIASFIRKRREEIRDFRRGVNVDLNEKWANPFERPPSWTKHRKYTRVNGTYASEARARQRLPHFRPYPKPRSYSHAIPTARPEVKQDPLQVLFSRYERIWASLSAPSTTTDITLSFTSLPWPLLSTPNAVGDITSAAIEAFIFHAVRPSQEKSRRARVRDELLRWHPDKFEHRVLDRVVSADRERVLAGADAVIKVLTALMASP